MYNYEIETKLTNKLDPEDYKLVDQLLDYKDFTIEDIYKLKNRFEIINYHLNEIISDYLKETM